MWLARVRTASLWPHSATYLHLIRVATLPKRNVRIGTEARGPSKHSAGQMRLGAVLDLVGCKIVPGSLPAVAAAN